MTSSSKWINDFKRQIISGKHILMFGNIHDQSIYNGEYMTALDFTDRYFNEKCFDIVVRYDPIDGLVFSSQDMRKLWQDTLKKAAHADNENGLGIVLDEAVMCEPDPEPDQASGSSIRKVPSRKRKPADGALLSKLSMEEAFAQTAVILSQNEVAAAVIVDIVDMLTTAPDRYGPEERAALTQLKKCSLNASLVSDTHKLSCFRNTLVITAGDLSRVPQWLYLDNPQIELVEVQRPSKEDRVQFFMDFGPNFFSDFPISDIRKASDDFANLTDGFQAWDLNALLRTSTIEKISVNNLQKLVDYFKFGQTEEYWEKLNKESIRDAARILSKRVIGQPAAIEAVTNMLVSARVGIGFQANNRSSQPKGVFFFVGPTGVGKTELAKALTEFVFSDETAFERFDMSEYSEEHAAEKLTGAPPGYVGFEDGGRLVTRMLQHPHSILLFDEIEKAHPRVLDKFLQILEDGRLTDGKGQTAYFNQSAIIFTSNLGASDIMSRMKGDAADIPYEEVAQHFRESVENWFVYEIHRAELLNRLGENIIPFDILRPEYVQQIAERLLSQLAVSVREKTGLQVSYDESLYNYINSRMRENDNLLLGGRRIKTLLADTVINQFNRWYFDNQDTKKDSVVIAVNNGRLEVE